MSTTGRQRTGEGIVRLLVAAICAVFLVSSLAVLGSATVARAETPKKDAKHSSSDDSAKKGAKKKKKGGPEEVNDEKVVGADPGLSDKQFAQEASNAARVDAVLVLDASRSMQRTDPKRLRDQGAKLFVRFLSPGDRVSVVQFDRDARVILPMTDVSAQSMTQIDQAIDSVPVEGGFTDIEAGIESAVEVLSHDGRLDATKTIVLLSDGKIDPHPSRGTPAELAKALKESTLSQFNDKHFKLYTVAFSDESDKQELAEYAQIGNGQSWYAPDASTIHKKFSELFLTLKRPQVVPLEGEGFEIDSSVHEATFYITRKDEDQVIALINPKGQRISSDAIPPGIKWFRGDKFDVITISKPLPGHWGLQGVEKVEGFATLLTDVNLEVAPLESSYKLGDTVAIYARLTNGNDAVKQPGLEDITFFTYKVINSDSGEVTASGALNDKGEKIDKKAGDGIYSGTVKLDKGGDYQAFIAVTSPTFTRQQRRSFSVSTGLISLKLVAADDFAGGKQHLEVALTRPPSEYKSLKVQLVYKKAGADKLFALSLKPKKDSPQQFDIPMEKIPGGDYEFTARMSGVDAKKKEVSGSSESVKLTVEGVPGAVEQEPEEVAEEAAAAAAATGGFDVVGLVLGIVLLLASGGVVFAMLVVGKKKSGSSKMSIAERKPYVVPEELLQRIQAVRERSSATKRRANAEDEREIFRAVGDVFGADEGGASAEEEGAS